MTACSWRKIASAMRAVPILSSRAPIPRPRLVADRARLRAEVRSYCPNAVYAGGHSR